METYIDKNYTVTNRTICSYTGKEKHLTIPSRFVKIVPDTLGQGAFCDNPELLSVTIPPCIRTINAYSFGNCRSLYHVDFQGNVEKIKYNALPIYDNLQILSFSHLHVTEAEYLQLKRSCSLQQDGLWITDYIPWNLLPKGLKENCFMYPFHGNPDSADQNTHIPRGIHALLPYPVGDAAQEVRTFLEYLPHSDQEYLSPASEAYNDSLLQTSPEKKPIKAAYFGFDDTRTEAAADGYFISAVLHLGKYYWPSAKRIVCSGKDYYICRRHILTDSSNVEYIREDAGVYTLSGPVTNPKEVDAVYAKYRLLSTLA